MIKILAKSIQIFYITFKHQLIYKGLLRNLDTFGGEGGVSESPALAIGHDS
jgi:hypothetical protein